MVTIQSEIITFRWEKIFKVLQQVYINLDRNFFHQDIKNESYKNM